MDTNQTEGRSEITEQPQRHTDERGSTRFERVIDGRPHSYSAWYVRQCLAELARDAELRQDVLRAAGLDALANAAGRLAQDARDAFERTPRY